ncbi:hypothetical protein [Metallibacterium sp.]|uniref:hypothetical protein n=1 Tax=Metallibacterium sp. TaxID=2940281 RepID=UPI00261EE02F|nr:hypothetical protein [Metallibacterium sp.]
MPKPARNRCDVNAELREVIAQGAPWVRRTEFVPMVDGSLRRRITRHDGTVEMDEVIDAARVPVAEARASTGLSQAAAPLASCIVWLYISPMIRSFRHKASKHSSGPARPATSRPSMASVCGCNWGGLKWPDGQTTWPRPAGGCIR